MNEYSDEHLVERYLAGDEASLEMLVKRYLAYIYSFIYRFVGASDYAEDITQDTFVRVWKNLKKFDQQKSFKTWIFSIAKNASIDFLKKKKTLPFSYFENEKGENVLSETLYDESPLPSEVFEQKELAEKVHVFIDSLSPSYRVVLFLHYNEHFTFQEISDSLEESIHTIKSRHRRALALLKKMILESIDPIETLV